MRMKTGLVIASLAVAMLVHVSPAGASRTVDADVLKRGRARPEGTHNIGRYVTDRPEYRRLWERFGYRSDRPPVNFQRRRVLFVATTESGSCPLRFQRVVLHRAAQKLVVHLSDGVSDTDACTDDLVHRSFVISVERDGLPRGDLLVRIRRH